MNRHLKTVVSIIAIVLALLMVFGLVVSVVPYVFADEYAPVESASAAEYLVSENAEFCA